MKTKHNKKRNTAFIYEALIREVSKSVIQKNMDQREIALRIIKEHFSKGTALYEEMQCYKALLEKEDVDLYTAEKIIHRAKGLYESISKNEIFNEQSKVIKKINKDLGSSVFSNYVPNYKQLATIAQIFSTKTPVKQKVLLEKQVIETISSSRNEVIEENNKVDSLVVKTFADRYNQEYSYLLPDQKKLLSEYVLSFGDNEVDFKVYLVSELKRIKTEIENSKKLPEIIQDEVMLENTNLVLQELENFDVSDISSQSIKKVLKFQNLVNEYKQDADQDKNQ